MEKSAVSRTAAEQSSFGNSIKSVLGASQEITMPEAVASATDTQADEAIPMAMASESLQITPSTVEMPAR